MAGCDSREDKEGDVIVLTGERSESGLLCSLFVSWLGSRGY